ncbi:hypothetical protein [Pseudomarimonas salicorniae]|uniref:Peptidase inhibitor I78 family protein n=1 Tax=Pseudomarimonas salicorniae TaxID=2933270 RepID=A0ABT0GH40_9GAMM|nr:hypothetical protein [Lysobacter sp. CAU 1642]MCK7593859.1 hypothetical protein [Lysobacter sp. CAU 1642]
MRAILLLGLIIAPSLALAEDCAAPTGAAAGAELDVAATALAWSPGEGGALSVDAVLARDAFSRCQQQNLVAANGYQKQTEFDNTPYRFNMKPGQKMSADEFDAWMASRGIRIVRAKADTAAAPTAPVVAE